LNPIDAEQTRLKGLDAMKNGRGQVILEMNTVLDYQEDKAGLIN
jgi:hypothetical protein